MSAPFATRQDVAFTPSLLPVFISRIFPFLIHTRLENITEQQHKYDLFNSS